jgi:2,4-dienoyl-CoA reductase-like NADH-dependent reductase (Old Yellow Enzyme family)
MSILFKPIKLGPVKIQNRFIHSATYEGMALTTGEVTDEIIKRYSNLAKGDVGLIIPGYMYIQKDGRTFMHQTGIHNDDMIPGLTKLVQSVHNEGGKIVFQLVHAGRQTTKSVAGAIPLSPSSFDRDPLNLVKPRQMTEDDIDGMIKAFGQAAKRAVAAGADGVQIHAAHGYLINQFLSPFFNRRPDHWGGSDEDRFRFIKEVYQEIKTSIPEDRMILVKLNTNDYTPKKGVTPSLAAKYAKWLGELGIDGIEVSCGSTHYSFMNMCRGDVPTGDFVKGLPWWKKPVGWLMMKTLEGKYDLEEGYNVDAAKKIKPELGTIPLSVVGGLRRSEHMAEVIEKGHADLISMSRPFIREPFIVKKFKEGKADAVSCVSCNKCLAAAANNMPVRCYNKG